MYRRLSKIYLIKSTGSGFESQDKLCFLLVSYSLVSITINSRKFVSTAFITWTSFLELDFARTSNFTTKIYASKSFAWCRWKLDNYFGDGSTSGVEVQARMNKSGDAETTFLNKIFFNDKCEHKKNSDR